MDRLLSGQRRVYLLLFYGPYSKRHGQNTIEKTEEFDKPLMKTTTGEHMIGNGKIVATCFAFDFFIPEADEWRHDAWAMNKERLDLDFLSCFKKEQGK